MNTLNHIFFDKIKVENESEFNFSLTYIGENDVSDTKIYSHFYSYYDLYEFGECDYENESYIDLIFIVSRSIEAPLIQKYIYYSITIFILGLELFLLYNMNKERKK